MLLSGSLLGIAEQFRLGLGNEEIIHGGTHKALRAL
jgi:hypothetical protein